ncbi:predicted protein [Histoplasma mississippiense (nom. inval.)]|uniref:predicted protein n=1 Tax=Ajellomyces capsulatus (strain NAm1 / WU24) TaxID=2059318 RepID=UPI000157D2DE|nr:predicted protein [Histoplasma mississippiense (nom. inval.)]EDN04454.1 predicted protein [Histoplasma mississippiense (nom. inval.)]
MRKFNAQASIKADITFRSKMLLAASAAAWLDKEYSLRSLGLSFPCLVDRFGGQLYEHKRGVFTRNDGGCLLEGDDLEPKYARWRCLERTAQN